LDLSLPAIKDLFPIYDPQIKRNIIKIVRRSNDPHALDILLTALKDADNSVRHVAVLSLAGFDSRKTFNQVAYMADRDPDADIKKVARQIVKNVMDRDDGR
jgi:HEAT repeat protein